MAANQQVTHDWWANHRSRYELLVSQAVVSECNAGDPIAASERSAFLNGITVLAVTLEVQELAAALLNEAGLPRKAEIDAIHIAVAALNGIDFLATWNCKHIANLSLRRRIESVLERHGAGAPLICTPQDMMYV